MVLHLSATGVSDPRWTKLGAPSIERLLLAGWETTQANHRQIPFCFLSGHDFTGCGKTQIRCCFERARIYPCR